MGVCVARVSWPDTSLDFSLDFSLAMPRSIIGQRADNTDAELRLSFRLRKGGEFIVKTLKAVVEGPPLPFSSKFVLFMCAVSKPFTPKRALSENWPL